MCDMDRIIDAHPDRNGTDEDCYHIEIISQDIHRAEDSDRDKADRYHRYNTELDLSSFHYPVIANIIRLITKERMSNCMIDQEKLMLAYKNDGFYSLQLEVGDRCEQDCIYCYMNALPKEVNTLSDEQITRILEDSVELGISAIEWLGGEPLLRNSIFEHMELARELGLRNNIWTGGLPLGNDHVAERCSELAKPGLISVHVSTVDPATYRLLHPHRPYSDLDTILKGVERLLDFGYPSDQMLNSVTFTGFQTPEDMIETIDYFEKEFRISTSLNVYHTYLRPGTDTGELERFIPKTTDVARVYSRLQKQTGSGPMPMNCVDKFYCSSTVAILCDGSITPCATIREKDAPSLHSGKSFRDISKEHKDKLIFKRLKQKENLPFNCRRCDINGICFGCRSRSYSVGNGLYGHDPRCFRSN